MDDTELIQASNDWGVVLLSIPSKHKKEIVKSLEDILKLGKRDAEKILSNAPLILLDDLSFDVAASIRNYFRKLGAVAEATNHEVIKKNYWKVRWSGKPDLSFFAKNGAALEEAALQENNEESIEESPSVGVKIIEDPENSEAASPHRAVPEAPSAEASFLGVDSDWSQRVKELDGKLRKIHREKQEAQEQRVEAIERLQKQLAEDNQKIEMLQKQLEEEKHQKEVIAQKAQEDLQDADKKQEMLTREGDEWRSKATAAEEKIRELEASLAQEKSEIEELNQQKAELIQQSEKAAAEYQQQLSTAQDREKELLQKIEELDRNVQQMTESLRLRDNVLAQFEKQIVELAEMNTPPQAETPENPS